ncbi:MAG: long-chain fatty acid transport protein [Candidatus Azotimanducaceae bacterium]|jgi:long-chain fatty acid transport protein
MKMKNRVLTVSALALISAGSTPGALATNGYFTHGLGVKNKSLAGAGTAAPSEAIAVASNPASAVIVGDSGIEVGLAFFSPRREYSSSPSLVNGNFGAFSLGPNKVKSDSNFFPIPYVGKSWKLGETSAFAVNFYGRGGMNTDYHSGSATLDPDGPGPAPVLTLPGAFGDGTAGVNLNQAFLEATYAIQSGPLSLGISAVFAIQSFRLKGVGTFAGFTKTFAASGGTVFPTNLADNGSDISTGFGFKVGGIWAVNEKLSFGLAYQSETKMSEFDDYSDIFAEGGGFDIPANTRISASYKLTPAFSLHLDFEKTYYSNVPSVANGIANIFNCPTANPLATDIESCLGGENGAGFGWDDVPVIKVGAEWAMDGKTTFRAGYSKAGQPIGDDQVLFNIIAPATVEKHFTFGFTRTLNNDRDLSVAVMYAPAESVSGTNPFDPTQTIEIEMYQYELEIGYSF